MPPKNSHQIRAADGSIVLDPTTNRPIWVLDGQQVSTPPPQISVEIVELGSRDMPISIENDGAAQFPGPVTSAVASTTPDNQAHAPAFTDTAPPNSQPHIPARRAPARDNPFRGQATQSWAWCPILLAASRRPLDAAGALAREHIGPIMFDMVVDLLASSPTFQSILTNIVWESSTHCSAADQRNIFQHEAIESHPIFELLNATIASLALPPARAATPLTNEQLNLQAIAFARDQHQAQSVPALARGGVGGGRRPVPPASVPNKVVVRVNPETLATTNPPVIDPPAVRNVVKRNRATSNRVHFVLVNRAQIQREMWGVMNADDTVFTDSTEGKKYPWPPSEQSGWTIQSFEVMDDFGDDDDYPDDGNDDDGGGGGGGAGNDQWATDAVDAADDEPLHTIPSILRFFKNNAKSVVQLKAQLREEYEVTLNTKDDREVQRLVTWVKEYVARGAGGSTKTGRLFLIDVQTSYGLAKKKDPAVLRSKLMVTENNKTPFSVAFAAVTSSRGGRGGDRGGRGGRGGRGRGAQGFGNPSSKKQCSWCGMQFHVSATCRSKTANIQRNTSIQLIGGCVLS